MNENIQQLAKRLRADAEDRALDAGEDGCVSPTAQVEYEAADALERQQRELEAAEMQKMRAEYAEGKYDDLRARLAKACGYLRTVGDDYPGSSCQQWCREKADECAIDPALANRGKEGT